MSEVLDISISPSADHKKLEDLVTQPTQNRYVVMDASNGYINYLLELAKKLRANIDSLKNRNPDNTNAYDSSHDQCARWEAQLEEVDQALKIISGDRDKEPFDIIDRLGQEYDHVLWLEAITVYQEKINSYENALASNLHLPTHVINQYNMAIEQLKYRIAELQIFLEQYNITLQVLGRGALEDTSLKEHIPDMARV